MATHSSRTTGATEPSSAAPSRPETLLHEFERHVLEQGDRTVFTFYGEREEAPETLTFAELARSSRLLAMELHRRVEPGGRVLLLYPSGLDFIHAFVACLMARVIAVPAPVIRRRGSIERLKAIVLNARPSLILTTAEAQTRTREAFTAAGVPLEVLATGLGGMDGGGETQLVPARAGDIAFLQYTSGSTGTPKGVVITHANLVENSIQIREGFHFDQQSKMVTWLPLFHDMGLIGTILQCLFTGFPAVLMPPGAFLRRPVRWLQMISEHRGTCTGAPNFAWDLAARAIKDGEKEGLDLSSLITAYNGAEPVRAETLDRFERAFARHGFRREAFFPCYGMAEATLFVTGGPVLERPRELQLSSTDLEAHRVVQVPADSPMVRRVVGCGRSWADTRIVIVDPETRRRVPHGGVGEIWVASASVARGYWEQDELSRRSFGMRLEGEADDTGFLRTGDLGFLHDGDLFVTGRHKDLIIIRGRNLYPQDLEQAVEAVVPSARANACAAFSVDHEDGERLVVVIEDVADGAEGATPVRNFDVAFAAVKDSIGQQFEVAPDEIVVVRAGTFPRTTSGKVQRSACRERLLAGELEIVARTGAATPFAAARVRPPAAPAVSREEAGQLEDLGLIEALALEVLRSDLKRPDVTTVDVDRPLTELGFDSLGMTRLSAAIEERLGRLVPADVIFESGTLRRLAKYAATATRMKRGTTLHRTPAVVPEPQSAASGSHNAPPVPVENRPAGSGPRELPERYLALLQRYDRMRAEGRYFYHQRIENQDDPWIELADSRLLMMGSYSYLGLLRHPEMSIAANAATSRYGTGAHGVRVLAGTTSLHMDLERRIAAFTGSEDAIVYSSGFVANLATISALVGEGDAVIGDEWNHASIIDGCRFSGAEFTSYRHGDMGELETALARAAGRHTLVVVDAVFSMEGDIVDLPRVVALCRAHGAMLMVDEAHSLGVLGQHGRGIQEYFDLPPDAIDVKMGCLSKALASCGGYVAGRNDLVRYLRHAARGYVFSSAMPAGQVAASITALEILVREPERVRRLRENERRYRDGLRARGFNTFTSTTPIVPISTGSEEITLEMTRLCRRGGVYVAPVFYPAVPMNAARLRTCVMASHSEAEIDHALRVITEAGLKTGLIH